MRHKKINKKPCTFCRHMGVCSLTDFDVWGMRTTDEYAEASKECGCFIHSTADIIYDKSPRRKS